MNSWPSVSIPPLSSQMNFPELKLETAYGPKVFGSDSQVKMYVCGITPYDATHLGHAATYLTFDLINRYLRASGNQVSFVENITDIDDPLLERAMRDDIDWENLASDQIQLFESDMTALRILPPDSFVPATTVMDLVSSAISKLQERGFVYQVEKDLYFDSSSFLHQLPIPLEEALTIFAQRGGDPERAGKKHPLDPVLWLAHRDGEPGWESVHGYGRPGWHIECCVISLRYLRGPDFLESTSDSYLIDIQGGGSDLIFPHHFMSAAQAAALTGTPFSYSFVHAGMVGLDGEKMSKSKGNLVFVSTLLKSGVDPMVIRWALLKSHYREDRMWTDEVLQEATNEVALVRSALSQQEVAQTSPVVQGIVAALSSDLDTRSALESVMEWSRSSSQGGVGGSTGEISRALDGLLGLAL